MEPTENNLPQEPPQPSDALGIRVYNHGGLVAIAFNRPIDGLRITKKEAKELAHRLIKAGMK